MKLAPASVSMRLLCLVFGVLALGVAWRLNWLGATGAEDVPPPFILVSGLAGIASLCVAILGRYPSRR